MALLMDSRDIILMLIGLIVGIVSWLLKELWSLHKKLDQDLNDLGKRLPMEFASKVDVKEAEQRLNAKFEHLETAFLERVDKLSDRISDWFRDIGVKIDKKADK